ncbi:hypothetical protein [Nocardia sp. alder85J]|uniref:hypothetical protein n=1 Tax=Nocardia sp. alder85J TaxID=2862949 RepID=UPI001CD23D7F|nr:hypothetical protein [Nocardia sp. alder85J]MCX4097725.1 hypothetical protein [Nocardia sp. alder85J]
MATSRHANPPLNVRPDAELKAKAEEKLKVRGLEMTAFVVACLTAVDQDPDGFLATLEAHWPPQATRGRPRKSRHPTGE